MGRVVNLYVNGVNTTKEKADESIKRLTGLIGEPIEPFYNETSGLLADVTFEVIPGWITGPTSIADQLHSKLDEIIQKEYYSLDRDDESELLVGNEIVDTIRIFCHSQGGLITANAISLLAEANRKIIEV